MHKPHNVSFDESLNFSTYERPGRSSLSNIKFNKENHEYSYSSHNASIKIPSNNPTFAANSPQCSNIHDSIDEIHSIPSNKLSDNFTFKKPLELRDNNKMRCNTPQTNYDEMNGSFEKSFEYQGNDVYLLKNEVSALRKALNEANTKNASLTKELSKIQHEYSLSQIQIRRNESRISELTENRTAEQAKVNELVLQRNQLNSEVQRLKAETHDSTYKTKEDVESLKKNLVDIEALVEIKNKNINRHAKHLKTALNSLKNSMLSSEGSMSPHCQDLFEKMQDITIRISNLAGNNSTQDLYNEGDKSASSEYETSQMLKEMVSKYQTENGELKDHILYLDGLLQKEQTKSKELLPQYRESVDKLRKGAHILKEKLKETKHQRKEEKRLMTEKLQEAEEANKSLVGDIIKYKEINSQLNGQIKHYELLAIQNEEKVQKLIKDHSRLESLIQTIKKSEEQPYRRSSRHEIYEDNDQIRTKKEIRSHSKDYRCTTLMSTEGDEPYSRNFIPRSNSMTKGRPNIPKNNYKDQHLYQKDRIAEYPHEQNARMAKTFSSEKGRNQNPFLTGSLEAERTKLNPNGKGYWTNPQGRISPNQATTESSMRKSISNYQTQDRYESNHFQREEDYDRNHSDRKLDKSFVKEKEENESECLDRDSDQEASLYDLKDEIASLDNEIGEIDRYMKEQLDTEGSTYL